MALYFESELTKTHSFRLFFGDWELGTTLFDLFKINTLIPLIRVTVNAMHSGR